MMNSIPVFSRACTRCKVTFPKSISSRISSQNQARYLSQASSQTTDTTTSTIPPLPSTPQAPARKSTQNDNPKLLTGTITRTGTMQQCIQITHWSQQYDKYLQKHYTRPSRLLVHDPHPKGYLREGDIIEYSPWSVREKAARLQRKTEVETQIKESPDATRRQGKGRRFMTRKKSGANHGTGAEKWVGPRYVVRRVITPFGVDLDQRDGEVLRVAEADAEAVALMKAEKAKPKGKGRRGAGQNTLANNAN